MKTALILGANGRFGQAATQAFADAGWQVLAQMRRAPAAPLPGGARALVLPLSDPRALAAAAAPASVVLHAVNPSYGRWAQEAMPLLRQGLAAARQLDARFMLPGNVYNFGAGMPALLDEGTPQRPSTPHGRIRCEMEQLLSDEATRGLPGVVIRAGDFFGCGSGSWLDLAIVKSVAQGRLVYPGPLDLPHAWAYLPDLAQAFVRAAERPAAGLQTWHFAGHTLTGRALLEAIEAVLQSSGQRPPQGFRVGGMPWGLIRAGGLLRPEWRALAQMSYLWRVPHALDGQALAAALGPLPHTPLARALQQALRALGLGGAAVSAPTGGPDTAGAAVRYR